MKARFIIFLCLMAFSALYSTADTPQLEVHADEAEHNGKEIILSGDVLIEHKIGRMTAEKAYLLPSDQEKQVETQNSKHFSRLRMEDHVNISLNDGSQLLCSRAEFDAAGHTGSFFSTSQEEKVLYRTHSPNTAEISSRRMHIQMTKNKSVAGFEAEEDVFIDYDKAFQAHTDRAWYEARETETPSNKALNGTFHLAPGERGLCEVTTPKGDCIRADAIHIDNEEAIFVFDHPKGIILLTDQGVPSERIHFSSDHLQWQDQVQQLTMTDHVNVKGDGIGELANDETLTIHLEDIDGKRTLKNIVTAGKTVLTHTDTEGESHVVTCYGTMMVDHNKMITTMESPRIDGRIPLDQRVTYTDRMGRVTADRIILLYQEKASKPTLKKLTVEGDVHIVNDAPWNPNDTHPVQQYALADKVEYFPDTRMMVLSSLDEHRVIFYDKINSVQVSADAIEVIRDGTTGKDTVRGIGDVSCTLLDTEIEQLQGLLR